MDRKKMRKIVREIVKYEKMSHSTDKAKVATAQSKLMEIYDDPEVFTCIDKIDDLVQEALHNG
jgi:2-phospho-L-lactate guanylyltransferase (CobY/MobA/RfbA family)